MTRMSAFARVNACQRVNSEEREKSKDLDGGPSAFGTVPRDR